MSTAALLTLLAALGQGAGVVKHIHGAPAPPSGGPGSSNDCETQIRLQVAGGSARAVDPSCLRLGRLVIGMSRLDVRRMLGGPDYEGDAPQDPSDPDHRYGSALYVFPRNLSTSLAVEPVPVAHFRLLGLIYRDDVVVRIDTRPGQMFSRSACHADNRRGTSDVDAGSSVGGFAAFQTFYSVRQGDPLAGLRKRFGRLPDADAAHSRYSYPKTGVTFEVDPKTAKILGFSLASDPAAASQSLAANVFLERDPVTCAIRGYRLLPRGIAAAAP